MGYQNCNTSILESEKNKENKENKNVLSLQVNTTDYLIFAGCFTAMTTIYLLSMLLGGITGIFKGLIPAICMAIAMTGIWKSRKAKDNVQLAKAIKKASVYDGYLFVIYAILFIGVLLAFIGAMVLLAIVFIDSNTDISGDSIKIIANVSLVFFVPIVLVGYVTTVYEHRRKYFKALSKYISMGEYRLADFRLERPPVTGSYVLGVWNVLIALGGLFSSLLSEFLTKTIMELIKRADFGDDFFITEELINTAIGFLMGDATGITIADISSLVLGGYFIFSAIWISKTHSAISSSIQK